MRTPREEATALLLLISGQPAGLPYAVLRDAAQAAIENARADGGAAVFVGLHRPMSEAAEELGIPETLLRAKIEELDR